MRQILHAKLRYGVAYVSFNDLFTNKKWGWTFHSGFFNALQKYNTEQLDNKYMGLVGLVMSFCSLLRYVITLFQWKSDNYRKFDFLNIENYNFLFCLVFDWILLFWTFTRRYNINRILEWTPTAWMQIMAMGVVDLEIRIRTVVLVKGEGQLF